MKIKSTIKTILFLFSIGLLVFLYFDYKKSKTKDIYKPTKEFYINDSANALLNSAKHYIYINGTIYYEDQEEDYLIPNDLKGVQIVVGTYNYYDNVDSTKVFNNYKIGKNDLGILLLLSYTNDNGILTFHDILFEIGPKMAGYLSAFEMDGIISEHFYGYGDNLDYDSKIVNLYYKLIEITSNRLFEYSSSYINNTYYDAYDYSFEKYTLTRKLDSDKFSLTTFQAFALITAVFLFMGSAGMNIAVLIITSIGGRVNKGGGGKSTGYYARK